MNHVQWYIFWLAIALGAMMLAIDYLLYKFFGPDLTFSRVFSHFFERWPATTALFFVWMGIWIGHMLPAR